VADDPRQLVDAAHEIVAGTLAAEGDVEENARLAIIVSNRRPPR
jgi:hypothetical protein